jgi:hypothetical protein
MHSAHSSPQIATTMMVMMSLSSGGSGGWGGLRPSHGSNCWGGGCIVVRKDVTWVDDDVSALLFPPASTDVYRSII